MVRSIALAIAAGLTVLSFGFGSARVASAQEETKDALQVFRDYASYGADLAYEGYLNASRTRQLGLIYGRNPQEVDLAAYWSYQSAWYGRYGAVYGYRDWVAYAGDAANASWNYNWGIFDVIYDDLYPAYGYDQLAAAFNYSYYAGAYSYYAEYYFDLAVDVVTPDEEDGAENDDSERTS